MKQYSTQMFKIVQTRGWEDGSMDKGLPVQVWGSHFESPTPQSS